MVLLEHPEHGRTHVYNDIELEFHLNEGWKPVEEMQIESSQDAQIASSQNADLSHEKQNVTPIQGEKHRGRQKGYKVTRKG